MRNKIVSSITVLIITIVSIITFPILIAKEDNSSIKQLTFISSADTNVYTERLVYEVFKRLDIDVSTTITEMDRGLKSVNAGIYDGICNQAEDIEELYNQLVAVPFETAKAKYCAITLAESTSTYNSWDDLSGKCVGSITGKPNIINNFPNDISKHIEKNSMSLLYESLRDGECDVAVIVDVSDKAFDHLVLPSDLKAAGLLSTSPCHIYLNNQHAPLIPQITEVLYEMEDDGSLARIREMKPVVNRKEKIVLYLSSYSSEMVWEQQLIKGVGNVLNKYADIVFHNIALNSYRNTDLALLENTALQNISVEFMYSPPDAVIVSDNEAANFLLNNYNSILSTDIPVITFGVNNIDLISAFHFDIQPNVVGVSENIYAADTVEEMLKFFPKTEQIFVINDYTLTGQRWRNEIEKQLVKYNNIEIVYNENITFNNLINQVASLNERTLILCGSYFLDKDNQYFPQASIQSGLFNAAKVPIFGLLDSSQGNGQLGGKYTNSVLYGEAVANILVKIFENGEIDHNEYTNLDNGYWVYDWNLMQRFGLTKKQIPDNAIMLNKDPSLREYNPILFYGVIITAASFFVIIIILAAFTFALRKRNQKLILADGNLQKSYSETEAIKNHLQKVLETAPIAYSLLVDDIVVESNSYYNENIGLMPNQKNSKKYSADVQYEKWIDECREKGFVKNIYWYVTKADGKRVRYLYNIANSEYNGQESIVMWGVEIESLEQSKDALSRAYDDLEGIIENTPSPIVIIYPEEQSFLNANQSWRELFKIPNSIEINKMKWGNDGVLTAHPMDELLEKAMSTEEVVFQEWKFIDYNGEAFDAIVYLKRIVFDGKECLLVTHRDLREEKAREQMLQNAAEKEREANRLKSHFLMNMSHEIRTPMNAIIGIAQLAKPTDNQEKLFESIIQISRSAAVLLNIINDVLDLSLIEDGKMILSPEKVSLSQVIRDIDTVVAVESGKKHIARKVNLNDIVHDTVMVDPSRLQQVIIAMANNAIKFTSEEGKISLTVKELENLNNISTFLFAIKDNGIGIAQNKMNRLFKSFEQGDDSVTRRYGGAGLGLSIAKSIVEMMDGKIWAESKVGKGSTFFFTIKVPVVPNQEEEFVENTLMDSSIINNDAKKEIDFSNLRILLVDDVSINRMIVAELLSELKIKTEEAENGKQALDMVIKAESGYYNLVFMDVQMPILDGCSATKAIRSNDRLDLKEIPIIAMTANTMPDDVNMIICSGMNGYIGKPIFLEQILETLQKHLKNNK